MSAYRVWLSKDKHEELIKFLEESVGDGRDVSTTIREGIECLKLVEEHYGESWRQAIYPPKWIKEILNDRSSR